MVSLASSAPSLRLILSAMVSQPASLFPGRGSVLCQRIILFLDSGYAHGKYSVTPYDKESSQYVKRLDLTELLEQRKGPSENAYDNYATLLKLAHITGGGRRSIEAESLVHKLPINNNQHRYTSYPTATHWLL